MGDTTTSSGLALFTSSLGAAIAFAAVAKKSRKEKTTDVVNNKAAFTDNLRGILLGLKAEFDAGVIPNVSCLNLVFITAIVLWSSRMSMQTIYEELCRQAIASSRNQPDSGKSSSGDSFFLKIKKIK